METTQRISLSSCPYLKLAKTPFFFLNKIGEQRAEHVLPGGVVGRRLLK
jgi:hypothetical protein